MFISTQKKISFFIMLATVSASILLTILNNVNAIYLIASVILFSISAIYIAVSEEGSEQLKVKMFPSIIGIIVLTAMVILGYNDFNNWMGITIIALINIVVLLFLHLLD